MDSVEFNMQLGEIELHVKARYWDEGYKKANITSVEIISVTADGEDFLPQMTGEQEWAIIEITYDEAQENAMDYRSGAWQY